MASAVELKGISLHGAGVTVEEQDILPDLSMSGGGRSGQGFGSAIGGSIRWGG